MKKYMLCFFISGFIWFVIGYEVHINHYFITTDHKYIDVERENLFDHLRDFSRTIYTWPDLKKVPVFAPLLSGSTWYSEEYFGAHP